MDILIKNGWKLNPNSTIVKAITKLVDKNYGICPCIHPDNDRDLHCPCDSYKLRDKCFCNLYIKLTKNEN